MAQSSRAATHRLDSCVSQDPCTQPHAVRGSDHGLRVECALGGSPRLGSRPCANRVGRGYLNYRVLLKELQRVDPDMPLMLEHSPREEDYTLAAEYIRQVARDVEVPF